MQKAVENGMHNLADSWAGFMRPWTAVGGDALQVTRSEMISKAGEVVDRWSRRRGRAVMSTWDLMSDLQRARSAPDAANAWTSWSRSVTQVMTEDARDQMELMSILFRPVALWQAAPQVGTGTDRPDRKSSTERRAA